MKHFNEEILHLYVLGSSEVGREKNSIERHLKQCAGCRGIVEDLIEYYKILGDNRLLLGVNSGAKGSMVVRPEYVEDFSIQRQNGRRSLPRRAWEHIERRPIMASLSGIGLAAMIVIALVAKNNNDGPDYFLVNRQIGDIEVYSNKNQLLWSLPSSIAPDDRLSQTVLAYVDGGATNELVTCNPLGNDAPRKGCIYVYDSKGKFEKYVQLPTPIENFRSHSYSNDFRATQLMAIRDSGQLKEILCVMDNTRSPTCLIRFDRGLNVLGTYWHFGQFKIYNLHSEKRGKEQIGLVGTNDVDDIKGKDFSFLAILDPDKIVGESESTLSPGFKLSPSTAEQFYIRFPISDMAMALHVRDFASRLEIPSDSTFSVDVSVPNPTFTGMFEYYFNDRDFSVVDLKYSQDAVQFHSKLKAEGKISSVFGEHYLENLRKGVLYWDGIHWAPKPTSVNPL